MTTRDLLLSALCDLKEEALTLGGDTVHIRELTAAQVVDARRTATASGALDTALWHALIVVYGVIDGPGGKPMFGPADVARLTAGREAALFRVAQQILALSEVGDADFRPVSYGDDRARDDGAGAGAGGAA